MGFEAYGELKKTTDNAWTAFVEAAKLKEQLLRNTKPPFAKAFDVGRTMHGRLSLVPGLHAEMAIMDL